MSIVSAYMNDFLTVKTIDQIVDETQLQLRTRSEVLNDAAPVKEYDNRNFLGLLVNDINPVASVVGYGQEIPTVSFGEFRKVTAEMAKIGISRLYDENLQWRMYEAMQFANLKGVTVQSQSDGNGNVVKGADNDLAMYLFGSVKKLVKSVMDRFDALTWQALQTGMVDLNDPRTNIPVTLNYRDSNASYDHFPTALTATGDTTNKPLNKWSDYANANGVQNLYDAYDAYIETNGFPPDYIAMSRRLYNHLMQQQSTKDAASMLTVRQVGQVSPDMLTEVLKARGIGEIKIVEDRYQYENEMKEVFQARFLNENTFVFIKKDAGIRAIGPTMESSPVITADGSTPPQPKSGVYVSTYELRKQPPTDITLAVMTALPVFINPKLLYSRVVN